MAEPIRIVPWSNPFIPALARHLAELWEHGPENILVVFPNDRPRRYLKQALAGFPGLPRPTLLPSMLGVDDLFTSLARDLRPAPMRRAQRLDLCGLLFEIISGLRSEGHGLLAKLSLGRQEFFPWGLRLASLLEEFLRHGLTPPDLDLAQGEVEPFAKALLEQLGQIFTAYVAALEGSGWSTPGLDFRLVCERLDQVLAALDNTIVVMAGHYALSGAEDSLFRALWERGAQVLWHTDPALAQGRAGHWCTAEQANWLATWSARAVLVEEPQAQTMPALRFYEGFDLHSQLAALKTELAEAPGNTAVILPEAGALIPVLHHLPERDVNISMGYPLERSALFQLLDTVLTLQENRTAKGYLWRDVISLIRHPYLKMLPVAGTQPLRLLFYQLEQKIRSGRNKHLDPRQLSLEFDPDLAPDLLAQAQSLAQDILTRCLTAFETPRTLEALALALKGLTELLHERGAHLWKCHLLDAECLFRLFTRVTPTLAQSAISRDEYPRDLLFFILRQVCSEERISFEPEPLTGLQVMGVLETRLLHFEKVCVLDAVEEHLPGQPSVDPLLPDPLRLCLGLPDSRQRDAVAGYNIHRLLRGAKEAVLLYKTSMTPGALENKSVRSRFVEELLWGLEQEAGKLINTSDEPPLFTSSLRLGPLSCGVPAIAKDAAVRDRLIRQITSKGLSPSSLDVYLSCPKLFFFRVLTGLKPLTTVDEEGAPQAVGSLVHDVLKRFLAPHLDKTMRLCDLDAVELGNHFLQAIEQSPKLVAISLDRRLALGLAGRQRLMTYLRSQKDETTLLALEHSLSAQVWAEGVCVPLRGALDRLDLRDNGLVVLDYKTSQSLLRPRSGVWKDEALWTRITAWDASKDVGTELLEELNHSLRGVQLPLYLWLADQNAPPTPVRNAGWVKLADKGQEILLLDQDADEDLRTLVLRERVPALTAFLIRHVLTAPAFLPRPGQRCDLCDFREPCGA